MLQLLFRFFCSADGDFQLALALSHMGALGHQLLRRLLQELQALV
jgi:hypothetical protein